MVRSVQEIEDEVRLLRVADRNRLLRDLIADIDGEAESDVEQYWLQEAARRYDEIREGEVVSVSPAEVLRNARSRLTSGG